MTRVTLEGFTYFSGTLSSWLMRYHRLAKPMNGTDAVGHNVYLPRHPLAAIHGATCRRHHGRDDSEVLYGTVGWKQVSL